jgi:hypothetical protein
MSIRHVVLWQLTGEDAPARATQADQIRSALEALVGVVPSVRMLEVRNNVLDGAGNYDLMLDAVFDDLAGLEAYATHPAHVALIDLIRSRTRSRVAVDIEI